MTKRLSLFITGVLAVVLVLFVAPILIGLDRVVRDGGGSAAARTDEPAVWLLLAGLSVSIVVAGYVLATYQGRRLTRPMVRLSEIAQTQPFRDDLIQMERTIDHLLHVSRAPARLESVVVLDDVMRRALQRWQPILTGDRRPIRVVEGGSAVVQGSAIVFDQVLDVLISNAHRHGKGTITSRFGRCSGGPLSTCRTKEPGLSQRTPNRSFGVESANNTGLACRSVGRWPKPRVPG